METSKLQKEANEIIGEFGELARQHNNPRIRKTEQNIENIKEEIADSLMLLMRIAALYNIDIENAITYKIKKLKERRNLG
jgi:NTP pyrophosphatase (non-canonical NTP hydrolase)